MELKVLQATNTKIDPERPPPKAKRSGPVMQGEAEVCRHLYMSESSKLPVNTQQQQVTIY
jgi:hypothetical protein